MRIAARVLILLCLPFAAGIAATSRIVLDPSNLGVAPIRKLSSSQFETSLDFKIAGIELEPVVVGSKTYLNVTAITPNPEKFGETGENGCPDLPVFSQLVGIPDQAGVRIEILSSSCQIINNYDVMPSQPPQVEGSAESLPFTRDEAAYQKNEFYPLELVQLGEPIICRDLRMIQAVLNPIQYNPVTKQLKVYTSVDYRLVYEATDSRNVKIRRHNQISDAFLPLYRALVPNADEMLASYEPVRGGYLIITPDAFVDTMKVLGRWKHLKGYSVVITKATDIDPGGNPTTNDIFGYIQNAYDTWDAPPEFVCIAGDLNIGIPDYPYGSYSSDHEYSCVDGDDYFSDLMITRMSFPYNLTVAGRTMRKALVYDRNPYMGDPNYWLRGLSVAGNIEAVTPRLTTLWVRQQLMRHGYTRVDTVFGWEGYDPGATPINNALNTGVSVISYRGVAGASGWGSPGYGQGNIGGLTHGWKMGIMASLVCGTGMYGVDECFGETWIRAWGTIGPCGGPGFYGVSDGGTHTKWNNPIMIGYYWAMLKEGICNFATAAFKGKVEDYNTYPRFNGDGSYVEQYFHTYNTLGEPEMEVRTAIPRSMTVTYPSSLPVGSTLLTVHVNGQGSIPLENAYVNLLKGYGPDEEVFVGGRTNSNGEITLDFEATVPDSMFVTLTATNYIPHLGNLIVMAQPVSVNASGITLDDDNNGNSQGNGDGNANPSEAIELAVTLRNFGNSTTATNLSATLVSFDSRVAVTIPTQSYPDIAPGDSANSGQFAVHLADDIPQGEHIILQLNITSDQGTWTAAVPLDVKSIMFAVSGVSFPGDSNGRLDPGETSQFVITLQNIGELNAESLTGVLFTSDTAVSIINNAANFGTIAIGSSGSNSSSPFTISAGADVYDGRNVNFDLQLTSSNGATTRKTLSTVVGAVSVFDPIGPDDYGYYMYDNMDAGFSAMPVYDWIEVSPFDGGAGTRITFPGNNTDDNAEVISLPFSFVYYGQNFSYMLVCINGFVAFDTSRYDGGGHHWSNFDNNQIPEAGAPGGLIAPFWDDLAYIGSDGVFRYYDEANHRFIIEWKNCFHPQSSPGSHETFEMIIHDPVFYSTPTGDAEIVFQYRTVFNDDNDSWDPVAPGLYCTVGMQNLTNDDGLQYTYDNIYHPAGASLEAGRAIKITTATGIAPPPDIDYQPTLFSIYSDTGQVVTDTLTISNVGSGPLVFTLQALTDLPSSANAGQAEATTYAASEEPIGYTGSENAKPLDFHQPIYPPTLLSHGGPDIYGNRWIDSDDPGGPAYDWVDISGQGTRIILSDDTYGGPYPLGFSFPFYENSYSSVYVSSNGYLSFGNASSVYTNTGIPDPAEPNNYVAMLWDDLNPGVGGDVYYYADAANNRFIVSYVDVPFYGQTSALTFEVMLYPTGRIDFEYDTLVPGGGTSNTVGIEDLAGADGLQVSFNSAYLHDSMALTFYPPSHWLFLNVHSGGVLPGASMPVILTLDATDLDAAVYTGHITISSNDPINPIVNIPVTFSVGVRPPCQYVPGDINDNGVANGIDVVYGVSYFKGGPVPPISCDCAGHGALYVAGDVNSSCVFNGIDVTYFVSYLKGGPALIPCPDCPPSSLTMPAPVIEPIPGPVLRTRGRDQIRY